MSKDRCVGHGVCESIAPQVFVVGDDAIAQVSGPISSEQQQSAAAAAASCPSQALRITEEDQMEIKMPKLDVTMTEGTFMGWLVADGERVAEGEDLYTVGTDKVETDIPAPCDGVLRHGDAQSDQTYPVGTALGVLEP